MAGAEYVEPWPYNQVQGVEVSRSRSASGLDGRSSVYPSLRDEFLLLPTPQNGTWESWWIFQRPIKLP